VIAVKYRGGPRGSPSEVFSQCVFGAVKPALFASTPKSSNE